MIPDPFFESTQKPLRLWPAVAIAIVQLLVMILAPVFAEDGVMIGLLAGVAGALLILLWWVFLSRAAWLERIGAIVLMVAGVFAAKAIAHESITGAGQGMMIYFLPAPLLALALVAWAVATRHLDAGVRRALLVVAIVIACAPFDLIRTAGVRGGGSFFEPHWRWTPTPEQRLLASAPEVPVAPVPAPAIEIPKEAPAPPASAEQTTAEKIADEKATAEEIKRPAMSERVSPKGRDPRVEWPGFRGPERDGIVRGVQINTDWSASPPVQIWRRPIGPGWSSFSVHGDLLYTQEQRGDNEIVACYRVSTGKPVWMHSDPVRFYESNGGAGPRATPTLSGDRVYTFGATGMLNALDAATGKVVWSRNAATDTKREVEMWGFSSSPLVLDDVVIIAVSGTLAGYDLATGKPRWVGPQHGGTYSSPMLATIDGVAQVLLLSPPGIVSLAPSDGTLLWQHKWDGGAITQPAMTADGDILINAMSMTGGQGVRRLKVAHGSGEWTVEERWTSNGLKPYFSDFVVHKGHAFGFDGNILSCIDLQDGKRKWKGGRYGSGQLVLLADQDVLLVTSEEGELALVSATPDKFTELARFPALDAKTWNHPVLVGDVLLVRNGEEMAAFRLSLAGRTSKKDTLEEK
jgi:outer membrane protein assembly factor BamB